MDALSHLEWPAMAVTAIASWLVGSTNEYRRRVGFWLFLLSNAMWTAWGLHADALALVALQVTLAVMNIRGAFKTTEAAASSSSEGQPAR